MTAAEAKNLSFSNLKKPPGIDKLLEKVFIQIEAAAKKGEFTLDFYEKKVSDENLTILSNYLFKIGYKVGKNVLGLSIYW